MMNIADSSMPLVLRQGRILRDALDTEERESHTAQTKLWLSFTASIAGVSTVRGLGGKKRSTVQLPAGIYWMVHASEGDYNVFASGQIPNAVVAAPDLT